ncbi:MAG: hypothetical protein M1305_01965 [Candidatus Marsarchaeota archaeon]|nr:hypothetical protein [Candidatus Marsarchaeota archaeon]
MQRYRVLNMDFDSRSILLTMPVEEGNDPHAVERLLANKESIQQELLREYGQLHADDKLQNFIDLGPKRFSILAFHNKFLEQLRVAFVMGAYYAALTGAFALGERILNHLLILLREDYVDTAEYKGVCRKGSIDNWDQLIDTLQSWGALLSEAALSFRQLWKIRWKGIHFDPATDHNDRDLALEAIKLLESAIHVQFAVFGAQPWFIPGIKGASYLRKQAENQPFIRKVYIPNCQLVGPFHRIQVVEGRLMVVHDIEYENREITDEEFRTLLETAQSPT